MSYARATCVGYSTQASAARAPELLSSGRANANVDRKRSPRDRYDDRVPPTNHLPSARVGGAASGWRVARARDANSRAAQRAVRAESTQHTVHTQTLASRTQRLEVRRAEASDGQLRTPKARCVANLVHQLIRRVQSRRTERTRASLSFRIPGTIDVSAADSVHKSHDAS